MGCASNVDLTIPMIATFKISNSSFDQLMINEP